MGREIHSMGSRSRGGHPTAHSYPQRSLSPGEYSAIDDYGPKYDVEYEDPYYERPPDFPRLAKQTTISTMKSSSLASPPLPPPLNHSTMQRLYCGRNEKEPAASVRRFKLAALFVGGLLLVLLLIGAFLSANARRVESMTSTGAEEEVEGADRRLSPQHPPAADRSVHPTTPKPTAADPLVSSNLLATLFAAQRKVCLFEVSTAEIEESRADFVHEHIDGARLLLFSNLTHSGVPVHPLQFQRSIRNQGVDSDCHVVLYDRGQADLGVVRVLDLQCTFLFSISFHQASVQLFGHEKTSVLNGGFVEWKKRAKEQPNLYRLNAGAEDPPEHFGSFRASWDARFVHTFDDVVANFHSRQFDLIDAQTPEEYTGKAKGATFGHIRTAVNLPIDEIFDWQNNTWPSRGISGERAIVLYDGVSLKSTMIFFALRRAGIEAGVFFGGWPEFAVRAPDSLKVIPNATPSSSD
ncbi:hypothetical protein M3Y99_01087700 [Aphelenchoides fujianensis]|nr:hypothetical protein M3Y99_01087700 [Aphelenchoides fujianensis]